MEQKQYGISASFDLGIASEVGIEAAVIYNELRFWADKGNDQDGWVYKSYAEMMEKFPLSEYQLRKAYKLLSEHGIIEVKLKKLDGAPTFHYRFLKNFRFHSEKTSDSLVSEKTSDSYIYTDNYHKTTGSDSSSLQATSSEGTGNKPKKSSADTKRADFVDQERVDDREHLDNLFNDLAQRLGLKRAAFSAERRGKLKMRLKTFTESDLVLAATNIKKDPFMQGQNDRHKFYGTMEYLLRNDGNIEKWLIAPTPQTKSVF